MPNTTCFYCGAPARKVVLMRGGDNGWGDDASRTVYKFDPSGLDVENISVQEAWEAAGGNPGIAADKESLIETLKILDQVCDDAAERIPSKHQADQASFLAEQLEWLYLQEENEYLKQAAEMLKTFAVMGEDGREV